MLPKDSRIKKKTELDLVFRLGKHYQSEYLSIKYLPTESLKLRFGISLGAKVSSSAAKRNRIKRIIMEHIRKNTPKAIKSRDVVIFFNRKIDKKELKDEKRMIKNLESVLEKCSKANPANNYKK